MSSTGYGPSAPSDGLGRSMEGVPIYDGRVDAFGVFQLKFRLAISAAGLGQFIAMSVDEYRALLTSSPARTTRSQDQSGRPLREDIEQQNSRVAFLLLSRLSDRLSKHWIATIPADRQMDGNYMWHYICATYGASANHSRVELNFEGNFIGILGLRWRRDTPLSDFMRTVIRKVAEVKASPKIRDSGTALKIVESVVLRHVLFECNTAIRYRIIHDKYFELVIGDVLRDTGMLDAMYSEVERLDLASPYERQQQQQRHRGGATTIRQGGAFLGSRRPADGGKKHNGQHSSPASEPASASTKALKKPFPPKGKQASVVVGVDSDEDGVNFSAYSVVSVANGVTKANKAFLVDSGATDHCCRERSLFKTFRPTKTLVKVANGKTVVATGKGDVEVEVETGSSGKKVRLTMSNVLFTPQLANNIFSTNKFVAASKNNAVFMADGKIELSVPGHTVPLHKASNLIWLFITKAVSTRTAPTVSGSPVSTGVTSSSEPASVQQKQPPIQDSSKAPSMSLQQLHERLGHLNFRECVKVANERGITLTKGDQSVSSNLFCEICKTSKQRKKRIPDQAARSDVQPGQIIHCDIKGPVENVAYNGAKYALILVDEATRITVAREMKSKDQCVSAIKEAFDEFSRFHGKPIVIGNGTTLHGDSEIVLHSKDMVSFLASRNVQSRASPPHTHERNGIVERTIQSLFDMVRSLLQNGNLEKKFWNVALQHAVYLRNRCPTQALGGKCPIEQLTGIAPSVSQLRLFGCEVFVKVDESSRTSLSSKSRKGVYVGHDDVSDSFRVMETD